MGKTGNVVPSIVKAEHIGPDDTGDNIEAKRVAMYEYVGNGNWARAAKRVVGGKDYDYIDAQQTSATIDTYVYKLGGSSGTVVQTIVVTYTDASKANIDTVTYS